MQKVAAKKTPIRKNGVLLNVGVSLICKLKIQHYISVLKNFGDLYTKIFVDMGGGGGSAQSLLAGKRNPYFTLLAKKTYKRVIEYKQDACSGVHTDLLENSINYEFSPDV